MTTASDLIEETKAHLFSGQEQEANRLDGAVTSTSATSVSFKYPLGSITRGAVIAVNLEEMRVWDTSGASATVERGVNGTTAATHADLAYVAVRPKFSDFRILRAINQDLADLCSPINGLYQIKTVDLSYNVAVQGYDLTGVTDLIQIRELRYQQPGPSRSWPIIRQWALMRNMDTSEFASGMGIVLYANGFPGLPIRVRYASDFTSFSALTDDATTVAGLPSSAVDLPPLGAAIRLVSPREINRNFTEAQGDPHRLEEIPPGAIMQSIRDLQILRQSRIQAEAARLQSDWDH